MSRRNSPRLLEAAIFHPRLIPLLLALIAAPAAVAEIYKWKDAQGKTHISDTPQNAN